MSNDNMENTPNNSHDNGNINNPKFKLPPDYEVVFKEYIDCGVPEEVAKSIAGSFSTVAYTPEMIRDLLIKLGYDVEKMGIPRSKLDQLEKVYGDCFYQILMITLELGVQWFTANFEKLLRGALRLR